MQTVKFGKICEKIETCTEKSLSCKEGRVSFCTLAEEGDKQGGGRGDSVPSGSQIYLRQ